MKQILRVVVVSLFALTIVVSRVPSAFASTNFGTTGSASGTNFTPSTCAVFTGPRDLAAGGSALAANEFLLTIANSNGTELSLTGKFDNSEPGVLKLDPDKAQAQTSFTAILRAQANNPQLSFHLEQLSTKVELLPVASGVTQLSCEVRLSGKTSVPSDAAVPTGDPNTPATDESFKVGNPVALRYDGTGTYYPGVGAAATSAAAAIGLGTPNVVGSCSLPANLQPGPQSCINNDANCLLDFAGYKWWTYNQYYPNPPCAQTMGCQEVSKKNPRPACVCGSGYWNNGNTWSPNNATVDGDGLHLFVKQNSNGPGQGGLKWMSAEVVLLENGDGSLAKLGHGTYLITAHVNPEVQDSSWSEMDPNVAFGAFTYEREQTGTTNNPARELDLAEISRWGQAPGECATLPILCEGNAQFTLQNWEGLPAYKNVKRYSIDEGVNETTLVMQWNGPNQHALFKQYNGSFTIFPNNTLPDTANMKWETDDDQNPFIPASSCQRFVLNFWMGNNKPGGTNPNPASPQEVVVTRFQFKPVPTATPTP